jgi:hypothetical protein
MKNKYTKPELKIHGNLKKITEKIEGFQDEHGDS